MEIQGGEDRSDTLWGDLLGAAGTIQLPGDLMIQIISRLPVKSILRFKSVCRAWYSLFSHPNFIQRHSRISNSYAKMNNLLSYLVHTTKIKGDYDLSLLLNRSCGGHIWIHLDLAFRFKYLEVMGSINGLVCLTLNMMATSIMLWNPAKRKHSRIPNPKLLSRWGENVIWGFVYDHKTDIYKVVRVLFFNCLVGDVTARVEIYNTGTNTWRLTEFLVSLEIIPSCLDPVLKLVVCSIGTPTMGVQLPKSSLCRSMHHQRLLGFIPYHLSQLRINHIHLILCVSLLGAWKLWESILF